MSNSYIIQDKLTHADSTLALQIVNFGQSTTDLSKVGQMVHEAWDLLSPYIHSRSQSLFIRDDEDYGKYYDYPWGNSFSPREVNVYVPKWPAYPMHLRASIHHELHHLARWNGPGYGDTLGGALISEGLATYFERSITGWSAELTLQKVEPKHRELALENWDSKDYDHQTWFFGAGDLPNQVGYAIGLEMAQKVMPKFDLEKSINITSEEFLNTFRKVA